MSSHKKSKSITFESISLSPVSTASQYFTWWISMNLPKELQAIGWKTKLDTKVKTGKDKNNRGGGFPYQNQHLYSYNVSLFDLPVNFFQNYVEYAMAMNTITNRNGLGNGDGNRNKRELQEEEGQGQGQGRQKEPKETLYSSFSEDSGFLERASSSAYSFENSHENEDGEEEPEEEEKGGEEEENGKKKESLKETAMASTNHQALARDDSHSPSLRECNLLTSSSTSSSLPFSSNIMFQCRKCNNVSFLTKLERNEHYKSNWHIYNIKRNLYRQPSVTEEQYFRLHEDGDEDRDTIGSTSGINLLDNENQADITNGDGNDMEMDLNGGEEEDLASEVMQNESAQLNFTFCDHGKMRAVEEQKHQQEQVEQDQDQEVKELELSGINEKGNSSNKISNIQNQQYGYRFSIWSALLSVDARRESNTSLLQTLSSFRCTTSQNNIWAIFLIRSGQFAAAIFDGKSKVLVHKTFKRYTTRRKAGGSQSSYDNKGKSAKSMGAQLRRYNEQRFQEDIQKVLKEWLSFLNSANYIFYSIPKALRSILLAPAEETVNSSCSKSTGLSSQGLLFRNDPRIRSIPFMVDIPTFASVQTVHVKLSTIKFLEIENDDITTIDLGKEKEKKDPGNDKVINKEDQGQESYQVSTAMGNNFALSNSLSEDSIEVKNTPLFELCKAQNMEIVRRKLKYVQKIKGLEIPELLLSDNQEIQKTVNEMKTTMEKIQLKEQKEREEGEKEDDENTENVDDDFLGDYDVNNYITNEQQLSCLHIASNYGNKELIRLLLVCGANPCLRDDRGRVPYFLCPDRMSRDVFRVYRGENPNPSNFDWATSNVPEPLTDTKKQKQKEKNKAKKQKAKQRKKEEKETKKSKANTSNYSDSETSGDDNDSDHDVDPGKKTGNAHGGSKFAKQQGYKGCWHCGAFKKKLPFRELQAEFCSEDCSRQHKREQMAKAAQKRMAFLQKQKKEGLK